MTKFALGVHDPIFLLAKKQLRCTWFDLLIGGGEISSTIQCRYKFDLTY